METAKPSHSPQPSIDLCLKRLKSPEPDDRPARLLLVGWSEPVCRAELLNSGWAPQSISHLSQLDPAPNQHYDALIWNLDEPQLAAFQQARTLLNKRGQLLAILPHAENTPSANQGLLPTHNHGLLRRAIQTISETGFAVTKDQAIGKDWRLLVAHKDPYKIRSYEQGDEAAILDLFPTCFFMERSLEHWRWKYAQNPYGNFKISLAFSPHGELAAHYAGYPQPFWSNLSGAPKVFLGLQMGDTMTNPEFRQVGRGKSGLLARTVRHFFAIHRDRNFGVFFGFNTGPIQRFCSWFIGGSRVEPVRHWHIDIDKNEPPAWQQAGYKVERVRATDASWDRLFRRVAPHYQFLTARDAQYVGWRYLRCPDRDFVVLAVRRWGRLIGWCVFRREQDRLIWGDALFHPRHRRAAAAALNTALVEPEGQAARRVEGWFSLKPTWWSEELRRLGFEEGPQPEGLAFMALPNQEKDAVKHLQDLYYTMGDGDLF